MKNIALFLLFIASIPALSGQTDLNYEFTTSGEAWVDFGYDSLTLVKSEARVIKSYNRLIISGNNLMDVKYDMDVSFAGRNSNGALTYIASNNLLVYVWPLDGVIMLFREDVLFCSYGNRAMLKLYNKISDTLVNIRRNGR